MKKIALIAFVFAALLVSCTDAKMAKLGGLGDEFTVELVNCDGSVSHSWTSSGKVSSEEGSDGYYFKDKDSGKLIEVTGNLIITKK